MPALLQTAIAPLRNIRLLVLHLVVNAILLISAALWLLIPEAHVWQLLFSALSAVIVAFCLGWLHCGTLALAAASRGEALWAAMRGCVRRVPGFVLVLAVLLTLMYCSSNLQDKSWQVSGYIFTRLPHWLQGAIGESRFNQWIEFKFAALTWFLLPALGVPWLFIAAVRGVRFRALRLYPRWRYWLAAAVASLLGVWLPSKLLGWSPQSGLMVESISLVLRMLVVYALALVGWLMLSEVSGSLLRADRVKNAGGKAIA